MELRAPPAALLARDRLHAAAVGRGQQPEPVGQADQLVEVVVPHARPLADVAEEPVALDDLAPRARRSRTRPRGRCGRRRSGRAAACRRRCRVPGGRWPSRPRPGGRARPGREPPRAPRSPRSRSPSRVAEIARLEVGDDLDGPPGRRLEPALAGARSSAPRAARTRSGARSRPGRSCRWPRHEHRLRRCWISSSAAASRSPGGGCERARSASRTGASRPWPSPGELTGGGAHRRPGRPADPAGARRHARAYGQRARRGRGARDGLGRRGRRDDDRRHALRRPGAGEHARALRAEGRARRAEAVVDVALYATVKPSGGLDEIAPLHAAGAAAFKVSTFETHPVRFPRVPDGELLPAMEICAQIGALVCFHPENDDIVRRLSRAARGRGAHRSDGACGRPAARGRERGDRPGARVRPRHGRSHSPLPRLAGARLRARRARARRRRRRHAPRPARTTS